MSSVHFYFAVSIVMEGGRATSLLAMKNKSRIALPSEILFWRHSGSISIGSKDSAFSGIAVFWPTNMAVGAGGWHKVLRYITLPLLYGRTPAVERQEPEELEPIVQLDLHDEEEEEYKKKKSARKQESPPSPSIERVELLLLNSVRRWRRPSCPMCVYTILLASLLTHVGNRWTHRDSRIVEIPSISLMLL